MTSEPSTTYPWRVWLAFEVRPGITSTRSAPAGYWRALANTCRRADGRRDPEQFEYWMGLVVGHSHLWGDA